MSIESIFKKAKLLLPLLMIPLAVSCGSQPSGPTARDLFYHDTTPGAFSSSSNSSPATHSAVAYSLELRRGDAAPVPCDNRFAFKSGDAIRLHIKVNEPSYIYVLSSGSSGKKQVLYPPDGEDNKLEPGSDCVVPKQGELIFDDNAGTEHLLIGLTREPIPQDRALDLSGVSIESNALSGKPTSVGGYSVLSSFGNNYELGKPISGDGQVYISNPDRSKPTVIEIAVNHTKEGSSASPSSSSGNSTAPSVPTAPTADQSNSGQSGDQGGSAGQLTGKWALLIGVDKFKDPNVPATGCTTDVAHISKFFRDEANFKPDHIIELTDENASVENIQTKMKEMAAQVQPTDLVVTYFSTHGGEPAEGQPGEPVILAYDGYIPMRTMSAHIKSLINTNRLVIILDTCHSGNTRALGDGQQYLRELFPGVGKLIVAGCQPHETSLGGTDGGVFTNSLLDGWRHEKLMKKSFYYAQKETAESPMQHSQSGSEHQQHPVINDSDWTGNDVDIYAIPQS